MTVCWGGLQAPLAVVHVLGHVVLLAGSLAYLTEHPNVGLVRNLLFAGCSIEVVLLGTLIVLGVLHAALRRASRKAPSPANAVAPAGSVV